MIGHGSLGTRILTKRSGLRFHSRQPSCHIPMLVSTLCCTPHDATCAPCLCASAVASAGPGA
ncbi:hypothetical protein RR42_s2095 [Cupriavidus basilensis]|uniref:Uncharacterized protein n=1 Tax=Cupriavidus basilensis TaxID=68895 RepID=A0A0C4YDG5_9BURK|nr:hypothetical protein RR42_s2095 [Cupriavidus basilensis]